MTRKSWILPTLMLAGGLAGISRYLESDVINAVARPYRFRQFHDQRREIGFFQPQMRQFPVYGCVQGSGGVGSRQMKSSGGVFIGGFP